MRLRRTSTLTVFAGTLVRDGVLLRAPAFGAATGCASSVTVLRLSVTLLGCAASSGAALPWLRRR